MRFDFSAAARLMALGVFIPFIVNSACCGGNDKIPDKMRETFRKHFPGFGQGFDPLTPSSWPPNWVTPPLPTGPLNPMVVPNLLDPDHPWVIPGYIPGTLSQLSNGIPSGVGQVLNLGPLNSAMGVAEQLAQSQSGGTGPSANNGGPPGWTIPALKEIEFCARLGSDVAAQCMVGVSSDPQFQQFNGGNSACWSEVVSKCKQLGRAAMMYCFNGFYESPRLYPIIAGVTVPKEHQGLAETHAAGVGDGGGCGPGSQGKFCARPPQDGD